MPVRARRLQIRTSMSTRRAVLLSCGSLRKFRARYHISFATMSARMNRAVGTDCAPSTPGYGDLTTNGTFISAADSFCALACARGARVELRVMTENALLVERQPPLRREVSRDPRQFAHPRLQRIQQQIPAPEPAHC